MRVPWKAQDVAHWVLDSWHRDGEKTKTDTELGFSLHAIGQNLMLGWGPMAGKQMATASDQAVSE